jgi:glycosyltransferase 2 family protein
VNRSSLIRGIQLVVAITLVTFGVVLYRSIDAHRSHLLEGIAHLQITWLVVALIFALQEGLCGGLRMFVLGRVLCPQLNVRTAIASEFVLMFVAGITPGQMGAPVSQVAVLVEGGMPFAAIATAELLTAFCTITFFLVSATCMLVLRASGHLNLAGASRLEYLLTLSTVVFGLCFVALVLCVAHPPFLKRAFTLAAKLLGPVYQLVLRALSHIPRLRSIRDASYTKPGVVSQKLTIAVDRVHEGFMVYLRRARGAVALALLLTFGFFCARFAVSYFVIRGLGLSGEPATTVTIGPAIVQVIIVQALLNFALYLSPTPGASGIAEAGSSTLMSPWVAGPYELPYLVLWRILALFLGMFVGGAYVFRYLGTDVLERRVREANEQAEEPAE